MNANESVQVPLFQDFVPIRAKKEKVDKFLSTADAGKKQFNMWIENCNAIEQEYQEMHVRFLKRNLELLRDTNTSEEERQDIMNWVLQPRKRRLRVFSFQACLNMYDPRCDFYEARYQVLRINNNMLEK